MFLTLILLLPVLVTVMFKLGGGVAGGPGHDNLQYQTFSITKNSLILLVLFTAVFDRFTSKVLKFPFAQATSPVPMITTPVSRSTEEITTLNPLLLLVKLLMMFRFRLSK